MGTDRITDIAGRAIFAQEPSQSPGMGTEQVMEIAGYAIYVALGLLAIWGVFSVILLARRIKRKQFTSEDAEEHFFKELSDHIQAGDLRRATGMCQSPTYLGRALPELTILGLEQQKGGVGKRQGLMISKFETGLLADLEYRLSWIQTVVRSAPMLGLLGTVVGMIGAFSKIAGVDKPNPADLATNISTALTTTALGLVIAIPLVLCAVMMNARIRRLEDQVVTGVDRMMDDLELAQTARAVKAASRSSRQRGTQDSEE